MAVQVLQDLIAVYPTESCIHRVIVAEAKGYLGALHCIGNDPASALPLLTASINDNVDPDRTRRDYQSLMKSAGVYDGQVDGVFGSQSDTAFQSWIGQGCPGLADQISLRRYGPDGSLQMAAH